MVVAAPSPPLVPPGFTPIKCYLECPANRKDPVRIVRVDLHLAVIEGPVGGTQDPLPRFAAVLGDVDPSAWGLLRGRNRRVVGDVLVCFVGGHDCVGILVVDR